MCLASKTFWVDYILTEPRRKKSSLRKRTKSCKKLLMSSTLEAGIISVSVSYCLWKDKKSVVMTCCDLPDLHSALWQLWWVKYLMIFVWLLMKILMKNDVFSQQHVRRPQSCFTIWPFQTRKRRGGKISKTLCLLKTCQGNKKSFQVRWELKRVPQCALAYAQKVSSVLCFWGTLLQIESDGKVLTKIEL